MSKKLIAILCGLLMPISLAFADMTSDVADPNVSNEQALANAIAAGVSEEGAASALVEALAASGLSLAEAGTAASNAGANPFGISRGLSNVITAQLNAAFGDFGGSDSQSTNGQFSLNGTPGSGQETEDSSYGG